MSSIDVTASLRYLRPGVERPVYIASEGGAGAALSIQAEFDDCPVTIHNARNLVPPATLDCEGFSLVSHITAVKDFYRMDSAHYDAEIRALVMAATGAESALVFDHTLRSDSANIRGERTIREPASVIHNDYSDASAIKRLRDLLPPEQAEAKLKRRFAIVNVWRSVNGPITSSPLALCAADSARAEDFVASERRARDRIGELELVTHSNAHRWYYFPEQQFEEALLIKTFDSATDGRARRVAHTAFADPTTAPGALPRESIESRLMLFF